MCTLPAWQRPVYIHCYIKCFYVKLSVGLTSTNVFFSFQNKSFGGVSDSSSRKSPRGVLSLIYRQSNLWVELMDPLVYLLHHHMPISGFLHLCRWPRELLTSKMKGSYLGLLTFPCVASGLCCDAQSSERLIIQHTLATNTDCKRNICLHKNSTRYPYFEEKKKNLKHNWRFTKIKQIIIANKGHT